MTSRYPFKFLDSYTREDHDFFFGREKEVNELYDMVFQADLLLLYGASGTGKSSLIQCGLAGKFQSHDWLALNIRRGSNINDSLEKALLNAAGNTDTDLPDWLQDDPTDDGQVLADTVPPTPLSLRLRSIYLRHFKPLYLVFDQFEELYTLGNKNEEKIFINTIRELLRVDQPVKIILSIREEYLGHLYEFERQVPELLRKKLRIEPMYSEQVTEVITKTGAHAGSNVRLEKGEEEAIANRIFEIIHGENNSGLHISLPYLQVLLDKYYLQTTGDQSRLTEATLTLAGLNKLGEMGDVLRDFLDEQVQFTARKLGYETEVIWKLLSPFVTLDGTKEPLLQSELNLIAPIDTTTAMRSVLDVLVERRVLRYSEQNGRYEIAHDTLAQQLHARRSDDEIAKLEIQRLVKTTVSLSEDKREYFSEKYLSLIDVYRKELQLSDEEEKWVEKSRERIRNEARELLRAAEEQTRKEALLRQEAENEKEKAQAAQIEAEEQREKSDASRRRATLFARGAGLLAVLAVLLAVYAYTQQREAILAQQKADSSARLAAEQRDIADSNAKQAMEQRQLAEEKTEEARANLERAQAEESRALAALKQVEKEKNATEEQRRRAEDNYAEARKATELARAAKDEAERNLASLKLSNEAGVRAFLQNAEENISSGDYREALKKINAASGLDVLADSVKAAYVKNIAASLEAGEVSIAFESAQSGYDKGVLKGVESGDICLGIAQAFILNMHYDTALLATRLAVRRGASAAEASSLYFELSYWHCETGSLEKSVGLLDTAYQLSGRRLFLSGTDTATLHGAMRELDLQRYEFLHDRYYPKMVDIAGGVFSMGSPESDTLSFDSERPEHRVTLSSYSMSATEVTVYQFGLYCALSGKGIRDYIEWPNSGDHPVVYVSWYDAVEYANWLSERRGVKVMYKIDKDIKDANNQSGYDGLKWTVEINSGVGGYRLPTESEWEYAARGGNKSKGSVYAGGDTLALVGWYLLNSGGRTHSVGEKVANELGLYDMSGNVWEWCWDLYGSYSADEQVNPRGAEKGDGRVVRGGSWSGEPRYCRAALRGINGPSNGYVSLGIRLAVSLQ